VTALKGALDERAHGDERCSMSAATRTLRAVVQALGHAAQERSDLFVCIHLLPSARMPRSNRAEGVLNVF
jgi:hypothetical protein